jgi:hypothetical protein
MSRGPSGYARRPAELYQTPAWVLDALVVHLPIVGKNIWEPACGEGQLVKAMRLHLATVIASDLHDYGLPGALSGIDFETSESPKYIDGIITNPPYGKKGLLAAAFIRRALARTARGGFVAMLLPIDFDCAKSRRDIFENCPAYAAKISLRRRIVWFDEPPKPGKKKNGPTENHAWFIWENTAIPCRQGVKQLYGPENSMTEDDTDGED